MGYTQNSILSQETDLSCGSFHPVSFSIAAPQSFTWVRLQVGDSSVLLFTLMRMFTAQTWFGSGWMRSKKLSNIIYYLENLAKAIFNHSFLVYRR